MRRIAVTVVVLAILAGIAWLYLVARRSGPHAGSTAQADTLATVPAPCPSVNDLQGIEGYAPGAGGAEQTGRAAGGMLGAFGGGTSGQTAAPAPASTAPGCRALAPSVTAQFDSMQQAAAQLPRTGYDPAALAATLADANAAFVYVRDHVADAAYAGAMRGASGTLMARGGSSEDKALLLAALLSAKNVPVRFVHATLADADADRLATAALTAASAPAQPSSDPQLAQLQTQTAQMIDRGIASARPIQQQILAKLSASGTALSSSDTAVQTQARSNVRDHWWVQAQQNGAWTDLDPSLSTAPGAHLGPAPADAPADQLPDAAYATIAFRVNANSGILVQKQVRAADVYAQPVSITIEDPAVTPATMSKAANFVPKIRIGSDETAGNAFAVSADLQHVWIEIEIDRPGYTPLVQKRTIFDSRTMATAQIPYALTTSYYGLTAGGGIDPAFSAARQLEATQQYRAAISGALENQFDLAGVPGAYPVAALRYFGADGALRRYLARDGSVRFSFDRPLIAFEQHGFAPNGKDTALRTSLDVFENGVDATGPNAQTAHAKNVLRGVVDDAIERFAIGDPDAITTRDALQGNAPLTPTAFTARDGARHLAWWDVNPQTGATVGRMDNGAGQAMTEYSQAVKRAAGQTNKVALVGNVMLCHMGAINGALSGGGGPALGRSYVNCLLSSFCKYAAAMAVASGADLFDRAETMEMIGALARLYNVYTGAPGKICGSLMPPNAFG